MGDGPTRYEVEARKPLAGATGRLVDDALRTVEVAREDVYVTNTLLCSSAGARLKDEEFALARECCTGRLWRELAAFPGQAPVLALGKVATTKVLEYAPPASRGADVQSTLHRLTPVKGPSRWAIPTVHPGAILRAGSDADPDAAADATNHSGDLAIWTFQYDVAKVARLGAGEDIVFRQDIEIFVDEPLVALAGLQKFLRHVKKSGFVVACDVETVPMEGRTDKNANAYWSTLTAVGLATEKRAVAFAWPVLNKQARAVLRGLLESTTIPKAFHNGTYDRMAFRRAGIEVDGPILDSMYLHHAAFPGLSHKLQRVTSQFFCVPPWKSEFRKGKGAIDDLLRYCSLDTLATARLIAPLQILVRKSKAEQCHAVDMKMHDVALHMQEVGIPISKFRNRKLAEYFAPVIERAYSSLAKDLVPEDRREAFFDAVATEKAKTTRKSDSEHYMDRYSRRLDEIKRDWKKLNLNSRFEVMGLIESMGVSLNETTKCGNKSTSKKVLEVLSQQHPGIRRLLRYRATEKLFGTFIRPMPLLVDKYWHVHPSWSPNKITGRWGSSPNFQNHSKGKPSWNTEEQNDKKLQTWECWLAKPMNERGLPNLRWQVKAPKGYVLIGADYNAIEARLVALFSGDPFLVDAFTKKKDIHTLFAKIIFPDFETYDPVKRKRVREHTKRAEYAYLYKSSVMRVYNTFIQDGYNMEIAVIERMFKIFSEAMPGVERFYDELTAKVMRERVLRSAFTGRRIEFPTGVVEAPRVANYMPQSSGADIMNAGIARFWDVMPPGVNILIQGHDALTLQCPEDKAEHVAGLLRSSLETSHTMNGITIEFPVEVDIGQSWADT